MNTQTHKSNTLEHSIDVMQSSLHRMKEKTRRRNIAIAEAVVDKSDLANGEFTQYIKYLSDMVLNDVLSDIIKKVPSNDIAVKIKGHLKSFDHTPRVSAHKRPPVEDVKVDEDLPEKNTEVEAYLNGLNQNDRWIRSMSNKLKGHKLYSEVRLSTVQMLVQLHEERDFVARNELLRQVMEVTEKDLH